MLVELFFLAYDFQVMDLMQRCENEIVNRLSQQNVTDLLIKIFPQKQRQSKFAQLVESEPELQEVS